MTQKAIDLNAFIGIALFCVLMGAGQILFRLAAQRLAQTTDLSEKFLAAGLSPHFWAAAVLYGAASLLWVIILARIPLSVAYPITTLTIVFVPIVSWYLFGDPISPRMVAGMLVILIGVWLIAGNSN
ncbi:MAG: hypothetical protein EPO46_06025 [Lysobacter sp.]|nr:MAG: hypothetical protein EPO46_06025 [Lysobacter sp.]